MSSATSTGRVHVTGRGLCLLVLLALCPGPLAADSADSGTSRARMLERDVRWIATGEYRFAPGSVSITVIDERGRLRVSLRGGEPMKPASNMKVLTTAAALHFLGPSYLFETQLLATSPLRDQAIEGDLILRGTGDPNISGRFYDGDPTSLLRTWARQLHASGLSKVGGDLIVDDSFFDAVRFPPTWDRAQEGRWYSAQVSPLSLNDNCIDLTIRPSKRAGTAARVSVVPACDAIRVRGAPKTVNGSRWDIGIHRKTGTNDITISGKIGRHVRGDFLDHVTVDDPALFFGCVLARVLEEEGIDLAGRVRRVVAGEGYYDEHSPARRPFPLKPKATEGPGAGETLLVRHTSSLEQDLPIINKRSQNLHAEILLRTLGARVEGCGSVEGGARAIRRFLEHAGLPASGLEVHDGSGLSHENRVSSGVLAGVLRHVMSRPWFELFRDSLAVAGVDGTLRKKFRGRKSLRGRVLAKTGYIRGVSCLSGYLVRESETWCFSILVNGPGRGSPATLQEKILARLDRAMR